MHNEYRILAVGPTRGLFPAALGVTRVAVRRDTAESTSGRTQLVRDPRNEFLQWNRAFDNQMAVSEVFPIAQRDLGGAKVDPARILSAIRALHARVGFVYAMNELSASESEMLGALYDTTSGAPLAVFHAQATSAAPVKGEGRVVSVDPWKSDAKALVRTKFEGLVYACVRELILHDEPAEVSPPEGWTPMSPIRPVEWPPRQLETDFSNGS